LSVPQAVADWCRAQGFGGVTRTQSVSGGCINHGARLETESGRTLFLKSNPSAPPDMFRREAEGLAALAAGPGPRVPQALLAADDFLLLEDLSPAPARPDYAEALGRQLAALHARTGDRFGFDTDNYLGSTPQPNPWTADGHAFFAEHRLLFQARLAHGRGLLSPADLDRAERLAGRLPELVPVQPPALIHGDLWGGNAITGPEGEPALIDPAAHYGWAEAELGMTALFGGFSEGFYRAYEEAAHPQSGWRERLPLYNLYHLLNHLNLFGSGYLGQVQSILRRYT
jgi:fructosamine-3-kinase